MTTKIYTVITFAPVQGFIEKSRKLRDLYGSSFLLSYLSWVICATAKSQGYEVISPAMIYVDQEISNQTLIEGDFQEVIQGMPNQIIIEGDFQEEDGKAAFNIAWQCVTETCREWIEEQIPAEYKYWRRIWGLWTKYAWEFFWVQGKPGESISNVRQRLNDKKYWRGWTAINWQGESSSLSGADAIAYPGLGRISDPRQYNYQQEKTEIRNFYAQLQQLLEESFIDINEELSVPELIKRMITHEVIADKLIQRLEPALRSKGIKPEKLIQQIKELSKELNPKSFKDLSRHNPQTKSWTGWFQGDGDKAGDYLKKYPDKTHDFSKMMRNWGENFQQKSPIFRRVIYAGGDDFFGVFYDAKEGRELQPSYCINQLSKFKTEIWHKPKQKPITVSVGFVWAGASIPQRDVLQHCRLAEKSAKSNGRDRIALRVLFNNGNYIEWVCPWWVLEDNFLTSYQDREAGKNWTHIYNDVAVLESRHAFSDDSIDIALGLLEIYFPSQTNKLKPENWWNEYDADKQFMVTGILGDRENYTIDNTPNGDLNQTKVNKAINDWIINLAKVGFHLCQEQKVKNNL